MFFLFLFIFGVKFKFGRLEWSSLLPSMDGAIPQVSLRDTGIWVRKGEWDHKEESMSLWVPHQQTSPKYLRRLCLALGLAGHLERGDSPHTCIW